MQATPAVVYKRFTRQVLYDHFKRIYTTWARDLILLPGSQVVFVGPALPVIHVATGVQGQPARELAQTLYNSLFSRLVGDRRVVSMCMQLSGAWLFAALPQDDDSITWVYEAHRGIAFVHCDSRSSQLRTHPIMERSILVPSIDFGRVGIALHTFDNCDRPVLQRRVLRDDETADLLHEGVSLLQHKIRLTSRAGLTSQLSRIPTPCRAKCAPVRPEESVAEAPVSPAASLQVDQSWTFWGPGTRQTTLALGHQCTNFCRAAFERYAPLSSVLLVTSPYRV